MKAQPTIIPDIVSQFAENCDRLWRYRENAAQLRTYPSTLADLDRLDASVDAQIGGLLPRSYWRSAANRCSTCAHLYPGRRSG
jgi:hypothetical protein